MPAPSEYAPPSPRSWCALISTTHRSVQSVGALDDAPHPPRATPDQIKDFYALPTAVNRVTIVQVPTERAFTGYAGPLSDWEQAAAADFCSTGRRFRTISRRPRSPPTPLLRTASGGSNGTGRRLPRPPAADAICRSGNGLSDPDVLQRTLPIRGTRSISSRAKRTPRWAPPRTLRKAWGGPCRSHARAVPPPRRTLCRDWPLLVSDARPAP